MRLKSFHAPTMAEAMRLVRDILGDDAIIVATREEEGIGVRVTAAIEEDGSGAPAPPPTVIRPATEIGPEVLAQVAQTLSRHGVPEELTEELLDSIADLDVREPLMGLSAALDAGFAFQPLPEGRAPRPIMLVGPPGAGKTLSVAKLCARAALRKVPVGVFSTDTDRAGGIDQLAAFTRLLKLRLVTVEDPQALADAMLVQRGTEQVLIDSAGRNPYSLAEMRELRDMAAAADAEPVLVLPAGIDPVEAVEIAMAFRSIGAKRLLPTRIDMARRLGSLLAAAHGAGLAFADAGTTSRAPDGLTPLTPTALARMMMPDADTAQTRRPMQTGTHA